VKSGATTPWRISRIGAGLAAFALAGALVDAGLALAPGRPQAVTALDYGAALVRGVAEADSWRPMRAALSHLEADAPTPVYRALFREQGIKFQYPPTSLLPFAALRAAFGERALSDPALNALAQAAAFATVALALWLLFRTSAEAPATRPAGRLDAALRAAAAVALALCFYPFTRGFALGQLQTLVDLLFAALVLAFAAGRPALAGALAGLACALKPTLGLLGLWALVRGQARFAVALAAALAAIGAAATWRWGVGQELDYAALLAHVGARGESFQPNQSPNGLAHRWLRNGDPLVWSASELAPYHPLVHAFTLAAALGLAVLALAWRRRDAQGAELEDLLIAALAATLAAPIAWEHHYGIALPIFAVALPRTLATPGLGRGALALLALAYLLLAHDVEALDAFAAAGAASPLASYTLAGGAALLAQLLWLRRARHAAAAGPV